MKPTILILVIAFLLFFISSCDLAGPAYPDKNGISYMIENNFTETTIDAVKNKKKMDDKLVLELSKCESTDVRFLVGRNPNLTQKQINIFINDANEFSRSGVATNPSLTQKQMETLVKDSSHTVYSKLAGNPSLPEKLLIKLYTNKKLDPLWLVMNPNCPEFIKIEVLKSNNQLAKKWLKTIDDWKKSGVFVRDQNNRWKRKK